MSFFAFLNRMWDGKPYTRDRISTQRTRLRGRRFTVSLMVQPIVMGRLLNLAGGASRGMGLIARFLLTWPASKIGQRPYQVPIKDMPAIGRLRQRLHELLDLPLPLDPENSEIMVLAPPALSLTARARRLWRGFHDDVEAELGKHGEYAEVADIGAKVAENAARLAGNFHVLEHGPIGAIDSKTMLRASKIILWHLNDARRVLAVFERSQDMATAGLLLEWLLRQPAQGSPEIVDPRHILRSGPSLLRDKKQRDAAIAIHLDHNILIPAPPAVLGKGAARYILNPRVRTA
jgi:putative DNA primase/helicase